MLCTLLEMDMVVHTRDVAHPHLALMKIGNEGMLN